MGANGYRSSDANLFNRHRRRSCGKFFIKAVGRRYVVGIHSKRPEEPVLYFPGENRKWLVAGEARHLCKSSRGEWHTRNDRGFKNNRPGGLVCRQKAAAEERDQYCTL